MQYHGATSRWQVRLDAGESVRRGSQCRRIDGSKAPGDRVRLAWTRESMVMLEGRLTVTAAAAAMRAPPAAAHARLSTFLYRRSTLYLLLLLVPPLLWLGTVYLGTLFALLTQSIYSIDEFTAQIVRKPTLATYKQLSRSRRISTSFSARSRWP